MYDGISLIADNMRIYLKKPDVAAMRLSNLLEDNCKLI